VQNLVSICKLGQRTVRFAFPLYTKDLWASHLKYPLGPSPPKTNNGDSDQPAQRGGPKVSYLWQDIQGVNSWKGLLDPMNPILKVDILRYGEFTQLCYDTFDDRDYSEYYRTCKHSKHSLFQKLGLPHSGYQVTKYIYANKKKSDEARNKPRTHSGHYVEKYSNQDLRLFIASDDIDEPPEF
jgi:hypothetical protein